jgi:holliday junction DNA helicase RuvA
MISALIGTVSFKAIQGVEIQSGQVGYWVLVPSRLAAALEVGKRTTLYTEMVIGEKILELYGFSSREEVRIFKLLTSVSGVGPRTALQIFNVHLGEEIETAIDKADVAFFETIKGIGRRTSQRLIVDLRSVLDRAKLEEEKKLEEKEPTVYQALTQLGFSKQEIRFVIGRLDPTLEEEEKVSQALRLLSKYEPKKS